MTTSGKLLSVGKWLMYTAAALSVANDVGEWAGRLPWWWLSVPPLVLVIGLVACLAGAVARRRAG